MTNLDPDTRVLYVVGDPSVAGEVRDRLESGHDVAVLTADSVAGARSVLFDRAVDCVVSEYAFPDGDALGLLDAVRERDPDLPFVLFTCQEGDDVEQVLEEEATRYVYSGDDRERTGVLAHQIEALVARRDRERLHQHLHEVAGRTQTARTRGEVFDLVVDTLVGTFEFDACGVRSHEEGSLVLAAGSDQPPHDVETLPSDRGPPGEVLGTGESRRIDDPSGPDLADAYESVLYVPIGDHGLIVAASHGRLPTQDQNQDLVELLASHVTASIDRIERERRLQSSDARLRAFSQAYPDYAFVYDEDGRYLDVMLGWELDGGRLNTVEELIGQTVHDVLPETAAETVLTAIRAALETGDLQKTKYRVDTPADPLWYEGYAVPLPDEMDDRETVILAARDVTARHRSKRELERQNERLDQFASLVSHDLRNPLSVADGYAEAAKQLTDDEEVYSYLESVQDSHDRMMELIDDLLTLAREGQTVTETGPVDLASVASDAWETVETGDATLTVDADVRIEADRSRLRRLFENCYRNAIEHGGATVTVDADVSRDDAATDRCTFTVADDGPGIPPERRETVLTDGFTTSDHGTGLGLSIVRSIVEAHGWSITVEEGPAGGAAFEISDVSVGPE